MNFKDLVREYININEDKSKECKEKKGKKNSKKENKSSEPQKYKGQFPEGPDINNLKGPTGKGLMRLKSLASCNLEKKNLKEAHAHKKILGDFDIKVKNEKGKIIYKDDDKTRRKGVEDPVPSFTSSGEGAVTGKILDGSPYLETESEKYADCIAKLNGKDYTSPAWKNYKKAYYKAATSDEPDIELGVLKAKYENLLKTKGTKS